MGLFLFRFTCCMLVFSCCYFLLQIHLAYFKQIWYKASLGEGKSILTYKNPLSLNYWANFNKLGTKASF